MNRCSNESFGYWRSASTSVFLLAASSLSIASAGCLDATAPPEADVASAPAVSGVGSPLEATSHKGPFESMENVAPPQPPVVSVEGGAHGVGCNGPYRFHAFGTDLFVSAELGYPGDHNGMLRARATEIGPWELFDLCADAGGTTIIRSEANGLLVSAEFGFPGGYNGMLRARANVAGAWEHFRLSIHGSQFYTLENEGNALLVSAEFAYGGGDLAMLRSRAVYPPGPWEMFD